MSNEEKDKLKEAADRVAEELDADVILHNGSIIRPYDTLLINTCAKRCKRKNAFLILVTEGGDADAGYRIARCLQTSYSQFFLHVSGFCKSAGTLIATGAHELIISDHGELGPLDVQMYRKDELWEMQSGLEITDTLDALHEKAFEAFEKCFLTVKAKSGGSITLKMAMQMAAEMTTGLFAPIYGQVNPLNVGEAGRALSIASSYGQILLEEGRNIETEQLFRLITSYPSHGFVIDRGEAERLFLRVRKPTQPEVDLANELSDFALFPKQGMEPFAFLSTQRSAAKSSDAEKNTGGVHDTEAEDKDTQRPGAGASLEDAQGQSLERNGSTGPDTGPQTESSGREDKGRSA